MGKIQNGSKGWKPAIVTQGRGLVGSWDGVSWKCDGGKMYFLEEGVFNWKAIDKYTEVRTNVIISFSNIINHIT